MSAELPSSVSCRVAAWTLHTQVLAGDSILSQRSGFLLRFPHSLPECGHSLCTFLGDSAEEQCKHWPKSKYLPEGSFNNIMINILDIKFFINRQK